VYAVTQLAQTAMRSELGKMTLDQTFKERQALNDAILRCIGAPAASWGVQVLRYEIRANPPPPSVRVGLVQQVPPPPPPPSPPLPCTSSRSARVTPQVNPRTPACNACPRLRRSGASGR
jgi:hypothetical protein